MPTLQAGQRVRVTAPDRGLVEQPGSLEALRDDSALIVTVGGRVRILPIATVTRLEVGTRHGHPWRGAAIGTGIGTLAGVLAYVGVVRGEGVDDCSDSSSFAPCFTEGQVGAALVVLSAVSGALGGLVIGSLIKTDHWENVPLHGVRVSVVPRQGGVGLGVAFTR